VAYVKGIGISCAGKDTTLFNVLPSFSLVSASWDSNWNLIRGIPVFIEINIEPAS
jgi:hypothetical protein